MELKIQAVVVNLHLIPVQACLFQRWLRLGAPTLPGRGKGEVFSVNQ